MDDKNRILDSDIRNDDNGKFLADARVTLMTGVLDNDQYLDEWYEIMEKIKHDLYSVEDDLQDPSQRQTVHQTLNLVYL